MKFYNHKWAGIVLGMNVNENPGPDLVDEYKFVELKFSLINPKNNKNKILNYPKSWTVLEHQMDYENNIGLKGYWGLGIYELDRPIKSIRSKYDLEFCVLSRELFIVKFELMNQFPKNYTSGKTKISEWENIFRYPRFDKIPPISKTYKVKGGLIHLTKWTNKNNFNL